MKREASTFPFEMKCCSLFRMVTILAIGFFSASAHGDPSPPVPHSATTAAAALGDAFAAVIDQSKGSVVSVLSEKFVKLRNDELPFSLPFEDPFFQPFNGNSSGKSQSHPVPVSGLGSGFVLDEQGHILTNNHVVQGMEKIHVVLSDKQSFEAIVLGSDSKTDIAVLQLKGPFPKHLAASRLGDSDTLKSGHLVLAFGAPFGLTQTVTSGIISATGRSDVGIADFEDFVQTDAPINPGNSGGPLVNMRGEVVGINTAIATSIGQSAGVGFAIPINMAKEILPALIKGKAVVRGVLGIGVQDVTPSLKKQFHLSETKGALVSQVNTDSPGEKAGIKAGDVIVKFAGHPIENARQLRQMVSKHTPGSHEDLTLVRNGKEVIVTAQLGEVRPESVQTASSGTGKPLEKFGIEATTLTPELKSRLNLKEKQGVVVTNIDETSPAALAGLQPGDVIIEVDRNKINNVNQANEILAKTNNPNEALFLIDHKGESLYVTLEVG